MNTGLRHALAASLFAIVPMLSIPACGGSDSTGGSDPNQNKADGSAAKGGAAGGSNDASSEGAAAKSGGGGWGASGDDAHSSDVVFAYDAPSNDAALNQDTACAVSTAEAKAMPLDIYLMLDRTGSMGDDCNVGGATNSKWCRAINAIAGFVQAPSSNGMKVAIQYFSESISGNCDGSVYNTPDVPLDLLPNNANALIASLNGQAPGGMTPTEGALRGVAQFTAAQQTPGRVMIGILVTDGDPTACDENMTTLASIASQHFQATGIRTFVIGMTGATFDNLEEIAIGGGAPPHPDYCSNAASCHYYNVGDGDPQAFIDALKQIQQTAIGCTWQMPTSDAGMIDPAKIVIQYSPAGTGPAQDLARVNDAAGCVANGWYYNDNVNPTSIQLCPAMCTTVTADPQAKVAVLLGCLGS